MRSIKSELGKRKEDWNASKGDEGTKREDFAEAEGERVSVLDF